MIHPCRANSSVAKSESFLRGCDSSFTILASKRSQASKRPVLTRDLECAREVECTPARGGKSFPRSDGKPVSRKGCAYLPGLTHCPTGC